METGFYFNPANRHDRRVNTSSMLVLGSLASLAIAILFNLFSVKAATDPFPGNPPIVPRWAFEPWVWEDNTNTQTSTENLVQSYLSRGIPVGAVLVDSPWETFYNTFEWDTTRYPNPQQMIDHFHSQGVRVVLWITGFVNNDSPDYAYVKSQGYAVNGGTDINWWKGRGVHIDFTNPNARAWWHTQMEEALVMGTDGWKVDMSADVIPSDPVDTSLGTLARDDFKKYYYADLFDYSVSRNTQVITLARPYSSHQGGLGAPRSKLSVGWGGDYDGDFAGLAAQKDDVYESAQQGYGAPGVEVGGFWNVDPTKNSLIRYAQFGALVPLMENGGGNGGESAHLPWYWDEETTDIYRYFATLHSELSPYLFSYGVEANLSGFSILRATDKATSSHKLGEELFVSGIMEDVTSKVVDFPSGSRWIDYWDDASIYEGGARTNYRAPLNRYPLFIRAGAILPLNVDSSLTGHGDSSSAGKVTLLVYPAGSSGLTFHRPVGDGVEYSDTVITVDEDRGIISLDGNSPASYRLRVKSFARPSIVTGADTWSFDPVGQMILIDRHGEDFTITITGLQGYGSSENSSEGLITDFVVNDITNAADWSVRTDIQSGDPQYGDRNYTISNLGANLAGLDWIRTANDSKTYISSPLVMFKVTADVDVYVAHRDEISPKPSWLSSANGWVDSGENLVNSEPKTYSLFKKSFPAFATVSLGNNSDTSIGMYTIIVKETGASSTTTATPTVTNIATPTPTPPSAVTPTATSTSTKTPTAMGTQHTPTPTSTPTLTGTASATSTSTPTPTATQVSSLLFADDFGRVDSGTIGNGWTEVEASGALASLQSSRMCFVDTSDVALRPLVRHTFAPGGSGQLTWSFDFDWKWLGTEKTYALWMQLGQGSAMSDTSLDGGIGVNLVWSNLNGTHERLGYRRNGVVTGLQVVSGPATIVVTADLSAHTYSVKVNGTSVGSGIPFDKNVPLDTVRFLTDGLNELNFSARCFDNVHLEAALPSGTSTPTGRSISAVPT